MPRRVVLALFAASGAAGLAYEVGWSRSLAYSLGSTIHAVSVVLAAFMAGFAVGGWIGGRHHVSRSWRAYLRLQFALGAFGLLSIFLLHQIGRLGAGAGGEGVGHLARNVLSFACLLPATIAMGATFPLVVAASTRDPREAGRVSGWLGGINLLGAAVGAAAAGYVMIRLLGIRGTIGAAAAINFAVAFAGRFVAIEDDAAASDAHPATATAPVGAMTVGTERLGATRPANPSSRRGELTLEGVLVVGGFASIGLQVAWTRILSFFLEGFTYTFASIVTTYLAALFVGSVVFGALSRRRDPRALFRWVAFGWPIATVGSLGVLLGLPEGAENLRFAFAPDAGSLGYGLGLLASAAAFLLLPTALLGAMLPLAIASRVRAAEEIRVRSGRAFALQNLGSAAGALCAGFVLLEHLGMKGTILALCAVGLAAAVVESACGGRARTAVGGGLVGAAALVAGSVAMAPSRPMILHSHVFSGSRGPEHRLVVAREGASGTASVVDNLRTGERFLYTEDFLAAGTGPRYHYMRLLAHLPALLAAERERALVIGFGSGTTVASLATHAFGAIDVVEIVPEVLEVAPSFAEVNARVLDDPRLDVRVGDGRHVLDLTDRAYDVITLEPLMPYTPGAVALYTEDFYRRGRARLTSGGVFCQWIPMHGIRPEHFRMLLRSFFRVFPETAVFVFETSAIVVGAVEDLAVRPDTLAARTAEPDVAADLAVAGYGTWRHLFGSLAADPASLATWLGEGPTMTDDRPVLEFHPLPRRTATTFGSDNLDALLEMSADPSGLLVEPTPDDRREVRELGEVARLLHFATAESGRASFLTLTGRRDDAAGHARLSEASLRAAVVEAPEFPLARRALDDARFRSALARGVALLRAGDHVSARAALLSATETRPDRPLGWYWLGRAYRSDGRIDEARAAFERAVAAFERHGDSLWQLADLDERAGDLDRARAWFRRVRELDARSPLGASRTRELRERLGPVGGP